MLVKYHPYKTSWPADEAFLSTTLEIMNDFVDELIKKSEAIIKGNHVVFEVWEMGIVTYIFVSDGRVHFHRKIKLGRQT